MGVGYYRPLAQWSNGAYAGANNREDDVAVMRANGAPVLADDHRDVTTSATPIATGGRATGVIGARTDRDLFRLDRSCAGALTVTATAATSAPDLDIRLRLLSATGAQLSVDDPASAMLDYDRATGLGATVTTTVAAGTYYLEVDGVGALDPASTGYDDFGSLGAYTLDVAACEPPRFTVTVPSRVAEGAGVGAERGAVGRTGAAVGSAPSEGQDAPARSEPEGSVGFRARWSQVSEFGSAERGRFERFVAVKRKRWQQKCSHAAGWRERWRGRRWSLAGRTATWRLRGRSPATCRRRC